MKVLHVESGRHLYGGPLQVQYLLDGLHRHGVESRLATVQGGDLVTAMADAPVTIDALPMRGDLDLPLIGRLRRLIGAWQPDLVHLHGRRGSDLLGGVAGRLAGVPVVLSRRVDNPEARWQVALKYRLFDHVIAISDGIRRVLLAEGLAPAKVTCVRDSVAIPERPPVCNRDAFLSEFELPADARVLGVVAQLIARKGHRFLLQQMPRLLERVPQLRLLLFGKGPLEGALREQVARLGLTDRVALVGFRNDLERWLPCLELLVHPALIEGLGVSLLQAAVAGVPIIASDAGGMPEAVHHGENGLLVPPGDALALGDAVLQLLEEPQRAQQMGAAGQALMTREFSIDTMVVGTLAVYRQVLAGRGE